MLQTYSSTVLRRDELTADVRQIELRLDDPPEMAFAAGQFVSFEIAQPGRRFPLTRPYSIVSAPDQRSSIVLLFNLVPGGPGSSFLDGLRGGDRVRFKGPAGTFVLRNDDGARDLLFVATGTGIAPLWSMLHARLAQSAPGRVILVWGLRREEDRYYVDELERLARSHSEFTGIVTLSRPSERWKGARGRVLRPIEQIVTTTEGLAVYVCGGSAMIRDVRTAVAQIGRCPVYWEQYYRDAAP